MKSCAAAERAAASTSASVASGRPKARRPQAKRPIPLSTCAAATALIECLRELDAEGVAVQDVAVRRPTLDDVFLTLTGHAAEDAAEAGPELETAGAR